MTAESVAPNILDRARGYVARGWQVVPIPPRSKGPTIDGWQTLRLTAPDIPSRFNPSDNIGVILGPPSGDLVDVDLDCPEAIALAPSMLPLTATFGRTGAPRSHWIYVVKDCGGIKRFNDPVTGGTIAEFRASGGQTVFPGSVHKTEELIEWTDGPTDPTRCDLLRDMVARLACQVLRERYGDDAPPEVATAIRNWLGQPAPPPVKPRRLHVVPSNVDERARAYLATMPAGIQGSCGSDPTFKAALALVKGFDLGESDALRIMSGDYNARCDPPWSENQLRHKISDAAKSPISAGYILTKSAEPPPITPMTPADAAAAAELLKSDPFSPGCLQLAATLMRQDPGEYEKMVAEVKALPGVRFRPWEDAVRRAARSSVRDGIGVWGRDLIRTKEGEIKAATFNARLMLERDASWGGVLAWNDHTHAIEWHKPPPWEEPHGPTAEKGIWSEHEDTLLVCHVEGRMGFSLKPSQARAAVKVVAKCSRYHPVRQYLEGVVWDGVPRVETWTQTYLGATSTTPGYLSRVGRWFLLGAVVRALDPGVKLDEMMVLEGGQGTFKSTACRVLGGEFYVEIDAATLGTLDKDTLMVARTAWILEAGEFDSLSGASMERVKSMVTRATDTFRVPYGADVEPFARGWVCIGTTNASAYLRDPSGARRFHPVTVGAIDIPALTRDRDQLWAEAVQLYKAKVLWYPTGDTSDLRTEQEKRYQVDPWQERVESYLATRPPGEFVTVPDVLKEALVLDPKDMNRTADMRVAGCLKHAGWVKGERSTRGGVRVHPWRPAPPPKERDPGEEG